MFKIRTCIINSGSAFIRSRYLWRLHSSIMSEIHRKFEKMLCTLSSERLKWRNAFSQFYFISNIVSNKNENMHNKFLLLIYYFPCNQPQISHWLNFKNLSIKNIVNLNREFSRKRWNLGFVEKSNFSGFA